MTSDITDATTEVGDRRCLSLKVLNKTLDMELFCALCVTVMLVKHITF